MKAETLTALQDARTERRAVTLADAAQRCGRSAGLSRRGRRRELAGRCSPLSRRRAARHGYRPQRDRRGWRRQDLPERLRAAAAADHRRRGAHRPVAGADGDHAATSTSPSSIRAAPGRRQPLSRREGHAGLGRRGLPDDGPRRRRPPS